MILSPVVRHAYVTPIVTYCYICKNVATNAVTLRTTRNVLLLDKILDY